MHQFFCLECKWKKETQEIEILDSCPMSTQKYCTKSMNHKDSILTSRIVVVGVAHEQ